MRVGICMIVKEYPALSNFELIMAGKDTLAQLRKILAASRAPAPE